VTLKNRLIEKMKSMGLNMEKTVHLTELRPERNHVIAVLKGDADLVQKEVDRYFSEYMPAGYGTTITQDKETEHGIREVRIERSASCD
jgi:hypothetical protein